jgi:fibronectin type 3 domain-containing protein
MNNVNFAAAAASTTHSVSLSWTASTSPNISGYNVYRGTTAGGAYTKVNSAPIGATTYADGSVSGGKTYYYVTTAVDGSGGESGYSNQATAVVPTP